MIKGETITSSHSASELRAIIAHERSKRREAEMLAESLQQQIESYKLAQIVLEETGISSAHDSNKRPICALCALEGFGTLHLYRLQLDGESCECVHHRSVIVRKAKRGIRRVLTENKEQR